jgi:adenylosuccinate lyase
VNNPACADELENHYECLGEAIQTVLRRHQVPNAYDIVKKFTRGTQMNRAEYRGMVEDLIKDPVVAEKLPEATKQYLLKLKPRKFIGEAAELAK